jgi:hypothetical protein
MSNHVHCAGGHTLPFSNFKMVWYVLLRPLRPELDAKTKTCLADGELSSRLDEQAKSL